MPGLINFKLRNSQVVCHLLYHLERSKPDSQFQVMVGISTYDRRVLLGNGYFGRKMLRNILLDVTDDLRRISENMSDAAWWRDKIAQRSAVYFSRLYHGRGGIDYVEEDWDNLIVLDACRADLFEEALDVERFDEYRRVTSNASLTAEWVKKNFRGRQLDDTVYVSASPHLSIHASNSFHELVEVWERRFDEQHYTVLPSDVTEAAIDAYDTDKRLIVHYLQPHQPYYSSDLWDEMRDDIANDDDLSDNPLRDLSPHPWEALKRGDYEKEEFWGAYRGNLETVYEQVEQLLEAIEGLTVITSDHGELFGESLHRFLPLRFYGHPTRGLRMPEVTEVPWAVIDNGRREVTSASVNPIDEVDEDVVEDRLAHLGYK